MVDARTLGYEDIPAALHRRASEDEGEYKSEVGPNDDEHGNANRCAKPPDGTELPVQKQNGELGEGEKRTVEDGGDSGHLQHSKDGGLVRQETGRLHWLHS